jgi:hypothetical protein
MKDTKPNSSRIRKNTATMPMSQYSSVSGLFSVIAISYILGALFIGAVVGACHTANSTYSKTDNCAYKDADNKL